MAEVAFAILGKVGEYLVAPIGRQFRYLFRYNNTIDNLRDEVNQLKLMRDGEQTRVQVARNNAEETNPLVEDWLTKVEQIAGDSDLILGVTSNVINGWCPNMKSRYLLGRRATKKAREVVDLKGKCKFEWVSCPVAPLATVTPMSTTYNSSIGFESRKSTLEEIINVALKDVEINVIGITGMGGVGKTTMVKDVRERVKEMDSFDEVAMAVVSQNRDISRIQGELGDELSLKFDGMVSVRARADKLRRRLKNGKRILIILDDLWEGLELEEVGIPVGVDCKVLLTSRIASVCEEMGTQKNFVVQVLSDEETWDLFKDKAGNCVDENGDLHSIAKAVAKECCGLPIAIVTLATALKGREVHAWRDALRQLRNSTVTNIRGMHEKVYSSIELSYNFLGSDQAKSLILLSCMFPENTRIPVPYIVQLAMGLREFDDIDTLAAKRDKVSSLIDELINCHLLLNVQDLESRVIIHDVIRDVGISIASKAGKVYLSGFNNTMWSQIDMHKRYTSLYLQPKEILNLPDGLNFSMLEHLVIRSSSSIPLLRYSFGKMEHVRVVHFWGTTIESLSESLRCSTNLSTLIFDSCRLDDTDLSFLGSMQNLEILSFNFSSLHSLPSSIGQLGNLKSLDLRSPRSGLIIPFGVLSGLNKLEELYMGRYFLYAHVDDDDEKQRNGRARVTELNSLPRLTTLQISISDPEITKAFKTSLFENLITFDFGLMSDVGLYDSLISHQALSLSKINVSAVSESNITVLARKASYISACEINNLKHICEDLYSLRGDLIQPPSLANLKFLRIKKCHAIKSLFSNPIVKCLVQLQRLYIVDCALVEEVVSREDGQGKEDSRNIVFPRLEDLCLSVLPEFRNIYPKSEDIVRTQNTDNGKIQTLLNPHIMLPRMKELNVNGLDKLLNVASSHEILTLQSLQVLNVASCDSIEVVFEFKEPKLEGEPTKVLLGQLESMRIADLPKLASIWRMAPKGIQVFQTLASLYVKDCGSLTYLFSPSMTKLLVNLKYLTVDGCSALEQIIMTTTRDELDEEEETHTIVFPHMRSLDLTNLHNLKVFMVGRIIKRLELPLLTDLVIKKC